MREKYFSSPGNNLKFKIQNWRFVFLTPPAEGMRIVFQYRSNGVVWDFDTFEEKSELTANTDVPVFDEYLVKLNILWRWLKRSGLDYGEEYDEFQRELKKRFGTEHAAADICLAHPADDLGKTGVIVNEVKVSSKGQ